MGPLLKHLVEEIIFLRAEASANWFLCLFELDELGSLFEVDLFV
jgi:hypothetical protein